MMGFPVNFSHTPGRIYAPAPELGQHTEEVLLEAAGYSREEINQLRKKEII